MTSRRTRALLFTLTWVAVLGIVPSAITAKQLDPDEVTGWRLRFYAASIDFGNGSGAAGSGAPRYDVDVGFGLGVNAEYRFSRRLGIDIGVLGGAAVDVDWHTVQGGGSVWSLHDTLTYTPLTAGLDIHLTPDQDVDLFVCPLVALVHYGGLVVYTGHDWTATTIDFDQDIALGGAIVVGVPLGERRWSFNANILYLESSLESDGWVGRKMVGDHDATVVGLGFGYRF